MIEINGAAFSETEFRKAFYEIPIPEAVIEKMKRLENLYGDVYDFWKNFDYAGENTKPDDFRKIALNYLDNLERKGV